MSDTCGCCAPNSPLTPVTIDNRPGLSAIAYRVGTFGSFRETMLDTIAGTPELANLTTRQSDDDAITLIDLWAALLDVITFYQERYANEVFLRTAQRPESLRRMARLLDYRPRPGVAAVADLAFTLDAGKTVQIPAGLRVQSVPAQGQQPQTFETLQAITADARFNRLRIFPQPTAVNPLRQGSSQAILDRLDGPSFLAAVKANDPVILFNDGDIEAPEDKKVAAMAVRDDMVTLSWTRPIVGNRWDANTQAFKYRRIFRLFGYNAPATFMQPTTIDLVGTFIQPTTAITDPGATAIQPEAIIRNPGIQWTLASTDFTNDGGTALFLDSRYSDLAVGTQLMVVVPARVGTVVGGTGGGAIGGGISGNLKAFARAEIIIDSIGVQTLLVRVTKVDQAGAARGPMSDTVTQLTLDVSLPSIMDIRSVRVFELVGDPLRFWGNEYADTLASPTAWLPGRFVATPDGMAIEVGRTIQQNAFAAGSVIRSEEIDADRDVILTDGQGQNLQGSVQAPPLFDPPNPVAGAFGHLVVPLQVDTLSLASASAVLLGNVARASQGQTVTSEVVGSGDASATFQSFTLQRQPLTYVPSSAPGGVSSTLRLSVNQLQWTEVPELFGQPATAQVFSTRTTEDGKTLIQAGGSTFGAPFPTGNANITATYRVGASIDRAGRRRFADDPARPAAGTDQRYQSAAGRWRSRSGNNRHHPAECAAHRAHLRSRRFAAGFPGPCL